MPKEKQKIAILDKPNDYLGIYKKALGSSYDILEIYYEEELFDILDDNNIDLIICDFESIKDKKTIQNIKQKYPDVPLALYTDCQTDDYISFIREMKILNVLPKSPLFLDSEAPLFIENIINPGSSFGLIRYLDHTIEMYIEIVRTRQEKTQTIEKVINHFATCGFDIHGLYDVRLILEEMINNCFFHAFLDGEGKEKYKISTFKTLEPEEKVIVEYGSDSINFGFSVTDNTGILTPDRIIEKLERQYNKEGIFDENGRGIYLSKMLSNRMMINIHKGKRTQIIALFREKNLAEIKPLSVNYVEEK